MWTHILLGIIVCALLAKQEKIGQDLSFLGQMTLFGDNAVEWVKNGTEISVYKIIFGTVDKLKQVYDINIETLHLELEREVFLLFEDARDRPVLVYQKSALAQVYRWLSDINTADPCGILDISTAYVGNTKDVLGQSMMLDPSSDRDLTFSRDDGKFGKYQLRY